MGIDRTARAGLPTAAFAPECALPSISVGDADSEVARVTFPHQTRIGDAQRHKFTSEPANPGDAFSRTFIERCRVLADDPPADWNGVWVMTSK